MLLHQLGRRRPRAPARADAVVEVEDGYPLVVRVRPRRGAVGQGFREEQDRPGRALVGLPRRRMGILDGRGRGVGGLVAARGQEGAALPHLDGGQLPHDPRQAAEGLAGDALVVVGVDGEAEEAAAVVGHEGALPLWRRRGVAQVAALHAEPVALGARQPREGQELVEEAHHDRVVCELLQRSGHEGPLVLGQRLRESFCTRRAYSRMASVSSSARTPGIRSHPRTSKRYFCSSVSSTTGSPSALCCGRSPSSSSSGCPRFLSTTYASVILEHPLPRSECDTHQFHGNPCQAHGDPLVE